MKRAIKEITESMEMKEITEMALMGIDAGSSRIKVSVISASGKILATATKGYNAVQTGPEMLEIDPGGILSGGPVCRSGRRAKNGRVGRGACGQFPRRDILSDGPA